jgi:formamidopyrimidine-DNA glycosylase
MPELPEVETIKNDLKKKVLEKTIIDIEIRQNKIVKNDKKIFVKKLLNKKFIQIDRRGKLLIFMINSDLYLLVHLKMTGQLVYKDKKNIIAGGHTLTNVNSELPNKYSHVIFSFKDGSKLFFNDLRRFGYLQIVDQNGLDRVLIRFGIEPLTESFRLPIFSAIIKKYQAPIKAVILNQKHIAGIGNIYADESLFLAGIKPDRKSNSLNNEEIKKLFLAINKVIKNAIKYRGTTFNNYVDASGNTGGFLKRLKVYGRKGEKCFGCKNEIEKIKVAGRGTSYCPGCQK